MTQEDINLLLKDLSARLYYGVICQVDEGAAGLNDGKLVEIDISKEFVRFNTDINCYMDAYIDDVKPYLRPMSSMTEKEREEWADIFNKPLIELDKYSDKDAEEIAPQMFAMSHLSSINWLYSKHFNIILPKEAFIEATEENNPYKE